MLAAYCIRQAGEPGPGASLAGVDGAPVRLLELPPLGVWLSEAAGEGTDARRLLQHDGVVRAALESATPLPLRFGTTLRDEAAARALLAERRDEFLEALRWVAGQVEMGIRVMWNRRPALTAEHGAARSGREFLEMRRRELRGEEARRREAEERLAEVELRLAGLGLPTARSVLATAEAAGTLAHLVQREEITRYLREVEEARSALPHLRLRLSGPWAPYSFVRPTMPHRADD